MITLEVLWNEIWLPFLHQFEKKRLFRAVNEVYVNRVLNLLGIYSEKYNLENDLILLYHVWINKPDKAQQIIDCLSANKLLNHHPIKVSYDKFPQKFTRQSFRFISKFLFKFYK